MWTAQPPRRPGPWRACRPAVSPAVVAGRGAHQLRAPPLVDNPGAHRAQHARLLCSQGRAGVTDVGGGARKQAGQAARLACTIGRGRPAARGRGGLKACHALQATSHKSRVARTAQPSGTTRMPERARGPSTAAPRVLGRSSCGLTHCQRQWRRDRGRRPPQHRTRPPPALPRERLDPASEAPRPRSPPRC